MTTLEKAFQRGELYNARSAVGGRERRVRLTIRTRSSNDLGSIGDEAADRTSSLLKPCQMPSNVCLNDCF